MHISVPNLLQLVQIEQRMNTRKIEGLARDIDFEAIAADWVRALRGRRSQAAFSRHLGYASSVVHRWERGTSWPTAAVFLRACERTGKDLRSAFTAYFHRTPSWLQHLKPSSAAAIAAFLRQVRGKAKLSALSESTGYSRYRISRWLSATSEPKLPEFLRLTEAASRRSLDFIAAFHDPAALPTAKPRWTRLLRMREAAYQDIWSHAVLRALELAECDDIQDVIAWLQHVLGITAEQAQRALYTLQRSKQVVPTDTKWQIAPSLTVATGTDPATRGLLTQAWAKIACDRMAKKAPGHFGYSLFSASRADLRRIRDLQMDYLREMQSIIAQSTPNECVGLLCVQLLDLSARTDNALVDS